MSDCFNSFFSRWYWQSNLVANVAATIASQGKNVGVVDTDIQSPGIHILFGLDESKVRYSLKRLPLG